MIERVSFTSNSPTVRKTDNQTVPINKNKENNNNKNNEKLLIGSLSLLALAGIGYLVLRKPKAVQEVASEAVSEAIDTGARARTKVKGRIKRREEMAVAGKEKHMNKNDAKWQRKNERRLVDKQRQIEENAQFTEEELAAYAKENGYQRPSVQRQQKINELNRQNAAEREVKNSIGERAKRTEPKETKPQLTAEQVQQKSLEGSINNLEKRIAGAKRMGKDTTALQNQLDVLRKKLMHEIADGISSTASK